ncbi:MAG: response regulator [Endomicrobium sp.]|nr:response regulator [Endomicrobium sp.]
MKRHILCVFILSFSSSSAYAAEGIFASLLSPSLIIPYMAICAVLFILAIYLYASLIKNKRAKKNMEEDMSVKMSRLEIKSALYASVLDSMPDFIFYTDIRGAYIGCNENFEKFIGVKQNDLIGKTPKDIFLNSQEDISDSIIIADKRVLTTGQMEVTEENRVYPNGDARLFEIIRAPLRANGRLAGVIGLGRDITERKASEKAAAAAAKTKDGFLSKISHEIRAPLNAIIGMSNIAKSNIDNKEKAIGSINESLKASNRLLNFLNNILDISQIETGKFEMAAQPFNIAASYAEISEMMRQECSEKNIKFTTNADSFSKTGVIGDKSRINQVIMSLLENAVKFTDTGGEISYIINILEETEKSIKLEFTIKDSGIGMDYKQVEKLLVPFKQTDLAAAMSSGGMGLGLAISRSIVKLMGSRIAIESVPGKGSLVSFSVDFEKDKQTAPDENIKHVNDSGKMNLSEKRILIVEDIIVNRIILKELLASTSVKTEEADDGTVALKKFENSPKSYYDLIFMDVQMPTMDGYEATRKIRALDRSDAKTVPIVAMTANAYKEDIEKAIESGMNAHLSKPIDIKSVMKALKYYLNTKK